MTDTSRIIPTLNLDESQDPLTRFPKKILHRDTSRFAHLSDDAVPVMPAGIVGKLEPRSSLQMATEGLYAPCWLQPDPYRPTNLTDVYLDGGYTKSETLIDEPDDDSDDDTTISLV